MKILVIEDSVKIASFLKKGLTENGYIVDVENNGHEGFMKAQESNYDLIILDIALPQMDGWSILKELRLLDNKTYIIILTAKDRVDDRVKGLKMGADDYLIKPFAFTELAARIETVLRRHSTIQKDVITFDNFTIDFNTHKVTRADNEIKLTPKEFLLLSLLVRKNNSVVSRSEISEKIWNLSFDTETNVVDVHIKRLRAKIDEGFDKKLIKTVRGTGYMFDEK